MYDHMTKHHITWLKVLFFVYHSYFLHNINNKITMSTRVFLPTSRKLMPANISKTIVTVIVYEFDKSKTSHLMTIFVDFYKIYDQFNQFEKIAKPFVS